MDNLDYQTEFQKLLVSESTNRKDITEWESDRKDGQSIIIFADMVDSTKTMERSLFDGIDKMLKHNQYFTAFASANLGYLVKTMGDEVMLRFIVTEWDSERLKQFTIDLLKRLLQVVGLLHDEEINTKVGVAHGDVYKCNSIHQSKRPISKETNHDTPIDYDCLGATVAISSRLCKLDSRKKILVHESITKLINHEPTDKPAELPLHGLERRIQRVYELQPPFEFITPSELNAPLTMRTMIKSYTKEFSSIELIKTAKQKIDILGLSLHSWTDFSILEGIMHRLLEVPNLQVNFYLPDHETPEHHLRSTIESVNSPRNSKSLVMSTQDVCNRLEEFKKFEREYSKQFSRKEVERLKELINSNVQIFKLSNLVIYTTIIRIDFQMLVVHHLNSTLGENAPFIILDSKLQEGLFNVYKEELTRFKKNPKMEPKEDSHA
jgi:class 3 adenylate cyclase